MKSYAAKTNAKINWYTFLFYLITLKTISNHSLFCFMCPLSEIVEIIVPPSAMSNNMQYSKISR